MKVPGQSTSLGTSNGNKIVNQMIGDDATIKWSGTKGVATGTVKYNADFSDIYPEEEKSGHYFPIEIDEQHYNKKVTVSGSKNGSKVITPSSSDPYVIQRLENLTSGNMTAKVNGDEIFTIDFSKTNQIPAVTVIPQEHNLGKYEKDVKDLIGSDVKISSSGEVTGNFKYVQDFDKFGSDVEKHKGYYLPVRLDSQYISKTVKVKGVNETTITVNAETDRDIILYVVDKDSKFTFKDDKDAVFMTLTFQKATFAEKI